MAYKRGLLLLGIILILSGFTAGLRSETDIQHRYDVVLLSNSSTRSIFVTVYNADTSTREFNTSVKGVGSFPDGDFYREYSLSQKEKERFRLVIDPPAPGKHSLEVVTRDKELGIESRDSIGVLSRESGPGDVRDIPGIGFLQFLAITLVSTVLASASL